MNESSPDRRWTVAETKARLSEILRLAEEQGPQKIGVRRHFVIVSARMWREKAPERESLGRWLIENVPRGLSLDPPCDRASRRAIPFATDDG